MVYELKYKCGFSDYYVPHITYKYRKAGKFLWEAKDTTEIDHFAYSKWKNEYYEFNYKDMSRYSRMCTMRNILDEKYNGSLENYVKAMVEFEIMVNLIKADMDKETFDICLSLVTDGWEKTTIKLDIKECSDEKLD